MSNRSLSLSSSSKFGPIPGGTNYSQTYLVILFSSSDVTEYVTCLAKQGASHTQQVADLVQTNSAGYLWSVITH